MGRLSCETTLRSGSSLPMVALLYSPLPEESTGVLAAGSEDCGTWFGWFPCWKDPDCDGEML